jgi:DNA polymerase III sliding clamp (beta) subunit (PCNA family)
LKFKIKVGELVEQIAQAAITVDPKSLGQPNSKVYLRAAQGANQSVLYYYSTNQMAKTFIRSEVEILEPGETLIEANRLLGGLQGRDPELIAQLDVQPDKIVVSIGRNRFQLSNFPGVERMAKEVDALPFRKPSRGTIPASVMTEFIRRTTFCIPTSSNGQQRFAVDVLNLKTNGSLYEAQATDGNIVSINRARIEEGVEVNIPNLLIPQEVLAPLQKLLGKHQSAAVELVSGDGSVDPSQPIQELFFRLKGVLFGCSLRSGKYPNLALLSEQHKPSFEITANRNELKGSLVRASNFVLDGTRYVQFVLDETNSLGVRAANSEDNSDIKDEVDCAVEFGEFKKMQITLTLDYIANVVATVPGDKVTLGFHPDKQKAVVVRSETRSEDDQLILGSTYAVSPVQPQKK